MPGSSQDVAVVRVGKGERPDQILVGGVRATGPRSHQLTAPITHLPGCRPDPGWRASTVIALCVSIARMGRSDAFAVLADALQDAGCESEDIVGHCRGSGPHVRGCWVVDLLLGES